MSYVMGQEETQPYLTVGRLRMTLKRFGDPKVSAILRSACGGIDHLFQECWECDKSVAVDMFIPGFEIDAPRPL